MTLNYYILCDGTFEFEYIISVVDDFLNSDQTDSRKN